MEKNVPGSGRGVGGALPDGVGRNAEGSGEAFARGCDGHVAMTLHGEECLRRTASPDRESE